MGKRLAAPPGWVRTPYNVYIPLPGGTSAAELITDIAFDFEFAVEKAVAATAIASTGAGATRTFRVLKGAATVVATGTITLAGTNTLGKLTLLTVTDDGETNVFRPGDILTVDSPTAGAVAFTAGAINLALLLRTRAQTLA